MPALASALSDTLTGAATAAGRVGKDIRVMPRKETPGSIFGKQLQSSIDKLFKQNIVVTAVKIKYPGIDPLLIIQARTTEGPQIAFIGGRDLDHIGTALGSLVAAEAVKWRQDEWEMRRLAGKEEDG